MKKLLLVLTLVSHFIFGQNNPPIRNSANETVQLTPFAPKAKGWSLTDTTNSKSPIFKIETPRFKIPNVPFTSDTSKFSWLLVGKGDSTWRVAKSLVGGSGGGGIGLTSVYSANLDIAVDSSITGKRRLTLNKALNSGQINIGDGTNTAFPRTLSGDVTVNNTGVTTISNAAVTTSKIADLTSIGFLAQSSAPFAYDYGTNGTKVFSDSIGRVSYTRRNGGSVINYTQDDFSPILGEIFNYNSDWTSLGFTNTGSNISTSVVGGKLRITNTTGNTNATDYINLGKTTWLPQLELTTYFTAITNGNGIALGYFSSYMCRFDMNAAGDRGTLTINSLVGATPTQVATSAPAVLSYTNGERLYSTLIVEGWKIICRVGVVGTDRFVEVPYNGSLAVGAVPVPRPKRLLIYSFGGVQDIDKIVLKSNVKKFQQLAVAGNSNMVGSASNSNYPEIASSLMINNIPEGGVLYSASGANMADFLAQLPELFSLKVNYVSIHLGTNDAGQSVASTAYLATLDTIIKRLTNQGIIPIVNTVIPSQGVGSNAFIVQYNTGIRARASKIILVEQYNNSPLQVGGLLPAEYTTDGTHLNTAGHRILAAKFDSTTSYLFGTNKSFSFARNYCGATNEAFSPAMNILNTNPTQGNASTSDNNALLRIAAGNNATLFTIKANHNTGNYGAAVTAGTPTNSDWVFTTNSTERMRLFASGSFVIGASAATSDPSACFLAQRNYNGASSGLNEPNMIISNINASQGNGTTTFNRSFLRLNAGNGTVQSIVGAYNNSAGVGGQSLLLSAVTAHPIVFATSGTEYARLSPTGNFGIGTNNPQSVLHVSGSQVPILERVLPATDFTINTVFIKATSTGNMVDGFGPSFSLQIRDNAGVDNTIASIQAIRAGADNTSNMLFNTYNAGAVTEAIRLSNNGNVGIGVTAPAAKLHIAAGTASNPQILLANSTAYTGAVVGSITRENANDFSFVGNLTTKRGATTNIGTSDNQTLQLVTNNILRLSIGTTGIVTLTSDLVGIAAQNIFNSVTTTANVLGAATTLNFAHNANGAVTHNYSTGATLTATTKAINFGTGGASGSTTNITLGSATSGALGTVILNTPIRHRGYTVATLPTGVIGNECYVTDALAPTYNATVVGGGAVVIKVFFNGTNWVCN